MERTRLIYHLRVFNSANEEFLGHMVNITPKGMMLIGESPLTKGMKYSLRMDLPRNVMQERHVAFTAESTWCRLDPSGNFYSIGFRFVELDSEGLEMIQRLANDFYREKGEENPELDMNPPLQ
ncbi:MAG: PilZ domain-containing protein [Candidatus Atribacteria bacterium]|nr:PilZ domain-containing protein [Candidatus Atribacteria bacterium]